MKKIYQNAKIEILAPAAEDLITASGRVADGNLVVGAKGKIYSFDDYDFSNPV